MTENCKLCGKGTDLQNGHIIPNFVYNWLKDTSVTGHIRYGETPNRRVQDGFKRYWFCWDCEQKIQKWETQFQQKIFDRINNDARDLIDYRAWLMKFAVSISWRVLLFAKNEGWLSNYPANLSTHIDSALKTWHGFLLDRGKNPGHHEQHLLPLGLLSFHSFSNMPTNINRYFLRCIDIDVAYTTSEAYVYSKIGKILLVGFIKINAPEQWVGTKLHVSKGVLFNRTRFKLPLSFGNFILDKARKSASLHAKLSERQKERISDGYQKNKKLYAESDMYKAINQDIILFGRNVLSDDS